MIVEIDAAAEGLVDARVTRRLVGLEVSDMEVPASPTARTRRQVALFYRVLGRPGETLRIELWERGEFYGARRVSGSGNAQLRARRVALAAAELARRLKQRRFRETQRLLAPPRRPAQKEVQPPPPLRLALGAGARGAAIGPDEALLVGPALAAKMRFAERAALDLSLAALIGSAFSAPESPGLQWLELALSPTYLISAGPSLDVAVGLEAGAAVVHVAGARSVDGIDNARQTWSARAAALVLLEPRIGDDTRLSVGPSLGAVLRRIPFSDAAADEHRLGGLWLGAVVGVTLDPAR